MASSRSLQQLVDRCSASITEAAGACARARQLVETSARQGRRVSVIRSARAARAARAAGPLTNDPVLLGPGAVATRPLFTVRGDIDGEPVVAQGDARGGLVCPDALYQRACVVVALGDTFEGAGPPVAATLGGDPVATALTLMRAMDRVVSVDIAVSPRPEAGAGTGTG
jgi:hypothetical protein